jgi:hypothetical protein
MPSKAKLQILLYTEEVTLKSTENAIRYIEEMQLGRDRKLLAGVGAVLQELHHLAATQRRRVEVAADNLKQLEEL